MAELMVLKVIGAGFGRTGTLSIKAALEEIGFCRCYHTVELVQHPQHAPYWERAGKGKSVDWDTLFEGYQATVDFPACRFYRELMRHYPDAKVLLTVRNPETWYESTRDTLYGARPSPRQQLALAWRLPFSPRLWRYVQVHHITDKDIWKSAFHNRFKDKTYAIDVFNRHIEEVKGTVPPERLLVYSVKEGWQPLCRFLSVPVPTGTPFPHLNDRAEFRQRLDMLFQHWVMRGKLDEA
jgi:hypothetical protein